MAITKANFRQFSTDLEAALAELGEKYGVKITAGSAKANGTNMEMKINCSEIASDGSIETKEAADFKLYAGIFGLSVDDLNKEIIYGGKRYQITGAKPRSHKFPILAKNLGDGKIYKLPTEGVKKALGK